MGLKDKNEEVSKVLAVCDACLRCWEYPWVDRKGDYLKIR